MFNSPVSELKRILFNHGCGITRGLSNHFCDTLGNLPFIWGDTFCIIPDSWIPFQPPPLSMVRTLPAMATSQGFFGVDGKPVTVPGLGIPDFGLVSCSQL